jgi:hypothetical protein
LKYVLAGSFASPELQVFRAGAAIPDMGIASRESTVGCEAFRVVSDDVDVIARIVQTRLGVHRLVDQLANPNSITICAGGAWKPTMLIAGLVGTASDSAGSRALMKAFNTAIGKRFERIRAFRIGVEARRLLESGARLTIAEQCPQEFDLAP